MPGTAYSRPIIKLDFTAELGSGPDDPIWLVIKNPKLQPPRMLVSKEAMAAAETLGDSGTSEDTPDAGLAAIPSMAARLVVAWRVYATPPVPDIDPLTGEFPEIKPELLPQPSGGNGVSAEQFGALPMVIQMAVMREISEAVNPQPAPEAPTSKKSSSPRKASTTAPGVEGQ